jgi:CheY-like chemotaxis protein
MKILIAEDDELITKMYSTKLKNLGMAPVVVQNGEELVEAFKASQPDFIILDIMLPKLSGLDALRAIRQLPGGENVPVVVLSNLADDKKKQSAEELQVKEYIVKANLTPSQVIDRVRQYLPEKAAHET